LLLFNKYLYFSQKFHKTRGGCVKKLVTLFLACAVLTSSLFAGGFQLNEHGARAMAMAGAFTGLANDPSAIYFNPAGITQLDGTNFSAGTTMILPISSYTSPKPFSTETEMVGQTFQLINFYATQKLTDKLSVGVGVNNQFGLGTKWDPNWAGRWFAVETEVKSFFFTPVVAYKILDNLSISGGATIAMANVKITRKNPPTKVSATTTIPEFLLDMESDYATAIGFTAGVLWKPLPKLQIGASYRSESKFDLTGTVVSTPASYGPISLPNGAIAASLTTPQNAQLGIAYFANEQWTITLDGQYVGWSSYSDLTITGAVNKSVPRNYENTYLGRLGFEYKASDVFSLRFGVLYDHNPVPDAYVEPTLPDADRIAVNIGFGGKLTSHLSIDVAYMFESFSDRVITNSFFGFNGTYSNQAHLFGLNLGYSL
jgi:long-chain fatty acid transport protein